MLLALALCSYLFTPHLARRCYSCTGNECSYKYSHSSPATECPPGQMLCQSICFNGTINTHRCTNVRHDCSRVRGNRVNMSSAGFKRNIVIENDEGLEYTQRPQGWMMLKVTDCYLCGEDLCNFNYLCDNLKNAKDYEERGRDVSTGTPVTGNTATGARQNAYDEFNGTISTNAWRLDEPAGTSTGAHTALARCHLATLLVVSVRHYLLNN